MTTQAERQQPPILLRNGVRNFAKKLLDRRRAGEIKSVTVPTVEEMAWEYLEFCRSSVKLSTCSTYETIIAKHIVPAFGSVPITELKVETINSLLREKTFPQSGVPLAASTARGIVTAMRGILQYAGNAGWQVANFEYIHRPACSVGETRILSTSEQQCLKDCCCSDMDQVKLGVLICLFTGLRIGEICAMKWGDISLEADTITVKRTVQRIKNPEYAGERGEKKTKVIFDAPKSKCANRCIPIPSCLRSHMKRFQAGNDIFLLTGKASTWMEPRTLQNHFDKLLSDAKIRHINFHALRHTFATNCVEQGFDIKALSKILGHSDVSITLNTYVHPSVSVMRSYMDRLA